MELNAAEASITEIASERETLDPPGSIRHRAWPSADRVADRPRRILSIDGGGVRCVIAMEYLLALENELRRRSGNSDTRLCRHVDLIAGTSAGALLAAGIALGIPMTDVREFVMANVAGMFTRSPWRRRYRSIYDKRRLAAGLRERLGEDVTLGSSRLETELLIPVRNRTFDEEWLLASRAGAEPDGRSDDAHLDLPLWQIALASASAPAYFLPEAVRYGREDVRTVELEDGGMSGALNPSFRAFRYATANRSGPHWKTGEERLTLLSIGSGDAPHRRTGSRRSAGVLDAVLGMPNTMLQASVREQDALCRQFGRTIAPTGTGHPSERLGDEGGALFRYQRVNPSLATAELAALGFPHLTAGRIMPMDAHRNLGTLSALGRAFAETTVGEAARAMLDRRVSESGIESRWIPA